MPLGHSTRTGDTSSRRRGATPLGTCTLSPSTLTDPPTLRLQALPQWPLCACRSSSCRSSGPSRDGRPLPLNVRPTPLSEEATVDHRAPQPISGNWRGAALERARSGVNATQFRPQTPFAVVTLERGGARAAPYGGAPAAPPRMYLDKIACTLAPSWAGVARPKRGVQRTRLPRSGPPGPSVRVCAVSVDVRRQTKTTASGRYAPPAATANTAQTPTHSPPFGAVEPPSLPEWWSTHLVCAFAGTPPSPRGPPLQGPLQDPPASDRQTQMTMCKRKLSEASRRDSGSGLLQRVGRGTRACRVPKPVTDRERPARSDPPVRLPR